MQQDHHCKEISTDGGSTITVEQQLDESPTQAILRGIAVLNGVAETTLDPLYNSIEVDALEQLIKHARRHNSAVSITFTFEGYTIRVTDKRNVKIKKESIQIG
ncbi:HalOD1 output domain-containing protein [Natrinema gelatinilyticum]|uniref:HalOD1 output domain-containing protein n=1 Tax=Natrinema gelatinilyticum TaxID=2961571 RepID=UPI0020C2A41E|nr:HalOD1 output domain-containing protein [Natrinema gelatinilyticum]